MPQYASIFTAEATAIERALLWAASDSLSVLRGLQSPQPQHVTIFAILLNIHTLQLEMTKRVVLMWCPGHSNIYGNEQADKAAGSGARTPPPLNPITTYQDLKAETHKILTKHFQEWWKLQDPTGNKHTWSSPYWSHQTYSWSPHGRGPPSNLLRSTTHNKPHPNRVPTIQSQNLKQILSNEEHSLSNLFTYLNLTQLCDQI
jgi:hypothetical protein